MLRAIGSIIAVAVSLSAFSIPRANGDTGDIYIRQALERYFEVPQDAHSLALGGSSALQCQSASCIFMNPAGLGFERSLRFDISAGTGRENGKEFLSEEPIESYSDSGYGVISVPIGAADSAPRFGTFGLGYSRYQGGTDDSINTTPDGHRRTFGYGIALDDAIGVGYSLTFYDDQLRSDLADLHSHARFLHIFGVQFRQAEGLTYGGLFKFGVGQSDTADFKFSSDGLSRPKQFTGALGVSNRLDSVTVSLGIDHSRFSSDGNLTDVSSQVTIGSDEEGHSTNLRLGAGISIPWNLELRAGIRYEVIHYEFEREDLRDLSDTMNGPCISSGIGYTFFLWNREHIEAHLDYGVEYRAYSESEWQHLLTLSIPLE